MVKKFRILSLLLCLCLLMTTYIPVSASETLVKIDENDIGILKLSGIASKNVYAEEELLAEVTRAAFIGNAAKLIGLSDDKSGDEYYVDIADFREKNLINLFAKSGFLSVDEDRLFEPERTITDAEAVKIVIHMFGYGNLAQAMGGFPSGYMRLAKQIGLWEREYSSQLNMSEMFYLLGNALEIELSEPSDFRNDGTVIFGNANGKNLLSVYHNIYLTEGFMRAVGDFSIDDVSAGEGRTLIGSEFYKLGGDMLYSAESFVGQWVTAYYKEDVNGVKTVVYLCDDKTEYVEIEVKNIVELDKNYNLVYISGNKDKEYRIDRGATVIYNGEAETENHRELFGLFSPTSNGTAKLVDADDNGVFEYCIIKHYVDLYIDEVDSARGIIYNVQDNFSFTLEDYENVKLYNTEKDVISASDLRSGMVISYAASRNNKFFEGYVASELITGQIEKIKTENGIRLFTVNGTEYVILDSAVEDSNIGAGDLASFYINYFGQVSYIVSGDANTYKYALLLRSEIETMFDSTLKLRYFREDGQMISSEVADKVEIDGKVYTDANRALLAIPKSTSAGVYPQMVRLCLDEESKIRYIDTAYCSPEYEDEEMSLLETPARAKGATYNVNYIDGNYQLVAANLLVVKKTPIFCTPALSNLVSGNYSEDDFWLAPQVERDATAVIYGVGLTVADTIGYRVGKNTMAEGALLLYNRPRERAWSADNYLLAVTETGTKLDDEGLAKTFVSGYVYTKPKEYKIADDYVAQFNALGIDEGDVIAYGFNNLSEITEVRMIYDASQGGEPYTQEGSGWATGFQYDNTNVRGFECEVYYASSHEDKLLKMWAKTSEYENGICDLIARAQNVTIVDLGAEPGNMVSVRPLADVRCADEVGADKASLVLRRTHWDSNKEIVVINF